MEPLVPLPRLNIVVCQGIYLKICGLSVYLLESLGSQNVEQLTVARQQSLIGCISGERMFETSPCRILKKDQPAPGDCLQTYLI